MTKWLNEENDIIDGEEQLKHLGITVGLFVVGFCTVVIGLVVINS